MSKLDIARKPVVEFNAENRLHRKAAAHYLKDKTWGRQPIRFTLSGVYDNLVSEMTSKLTEYYVLREFDKEMKNG